MLPKAHGVQKDSAALAGRIMQPGSPALSRFDGFDKLTAGKLKAPSPSTPLGTLSLSNGRVEGLVERAGPGPPSPRPATTQALFP